MATKRLQILSNATITANGNSGMLPNPASNQNPTLVAFLDIQNAPTGTSPSLQVTIYSSIDGVRTALLAQFTAQTAQLSHPIRLPVHDVLGSNIYVDWTVSGTTPSFTGVNLDILCASSYGG